MKKFKIVLFGKKDNNLPLIDSNLDGGRNHCDTEGIVVKFPDLDSAKKVAQSLNISSIPTLARVVQI